MKIPTGSNAVSYGLMYGIASKDHTFFYDGWDKSSIKQYKRVVTANFCEAWIKEFCFINDISCSTDGSHFTQSDEYDITISGLKFDIKSSTVSDHMQVNLALRNKNVDGYIFCRTNDKMDMIEIKGIIRKEEFWKIARFVKHGEQTPDGWTQKFKDGSSFLHCSQFQRSGLTSIFNLKNTKSDKDTIQ